MLLYGREWTRRELEARVGRIEQLAGVRRMMCTEGPESGTEQIEVRTGAGLCYYITPGKGLDISLAEVHGTPISWQSPNGDVHPSYYNAEGLEWLRTASGGLLMTCGLMYAGSPGEDAGERSGLHGRAHHTPARQVSAESSWIEDDFVMRIAGVVDETSFFGGSLQLRREISSRLGENSIRIRDVVRNMGFKPCPHMMLYHFNFGFPLMSERTELHIPDSTVTPRHAGVPTEGYDRWQAPDVDCHERVYYHRLNGKGVARIVNPEFPVGSSFRPMEVRLSWTRDTLPELVQWRMPRTGTHVLGIEPANCHVEGRAKERERGKLVILEPGQSVSYELLLNMD